MSYNRFSSNNLSQKPIRSPSSDKCCRSVDMMSVSSRESFPDSDRRMSVCAVSALPPMSPSVSSAASPMSLQDASTTPPMSLCASSTASSTSLDPFIASPMSLYASSTASSMSIGASSVAYFDAALHWYYNTIVVPFFRTSTSPLLHAFRSNARGREGCERCPSLLVGISFGFLFKICSRSIGASYHASDVRRSQGYQFSSPPSINATRDCQS